MNDYTVEDIDPSDLIDCYIWAEVVHSKVESNKEPGKMVTFANLGDKAPAEMFDTEPVARALTLGKNGENVAHVSSKKQETTTTTGLDLDSLLGD